MNALKTSRNMTWQVILTVMTAADRSARGTSAGLEVGRDRKGFNYCHQHLSKSVIAFRSVPSCPTGVLLILAGILYVHTKVDRRTIASGQRAPNVFPRESKQEHGRPKELGYLRGTTSF